MSSAYAYVLRNLIHVQLIVLKIKKQITTILFEGGNESFEGLSKTSTK